MNKMSVGRTWAADKDERTLLMLMGMGCEPEAYDPMEKAMLQYCGEQGISEEEIFGGSLVKEYAFTNGKKMMPCMAAGWKADSRGQRLTGEGGICRR